MSAVQLTVARNWPVHFADDFLTEKIIKKYLTLLVETRVDLRCRDAQSVGLRGLKRKLVCNSLALISFFV